ncbi:uncharacterized protein LOC111626775 [Centruroides sculpturatus]|uniref:uncharacterized protein LOC111626775 n=1 Tax=Centruroides sculpturatus TaxID=218467 RepID=UPI000C6E73F7|nr:uncharacterized protein LOC111626775 [Centruroides sculpturatus]
MAESWSTELTAVLITEVKRYPWLWNPLRWDYRKIRKKCMAWRSISTVVRKPAKECQEKWRTVRDTYKKIIQRGTSAPTEGRSSKWPHMARMEFLKKAAEKHANLKISQTKGEESSDLEIDKDTDVEAKIYEEENDYRNDDDPLPPRLSDLISAKPRYIVPKIDGILQNDLQPPPLRPISIQTPVVPISMPTSFVPLSVSSSVTSNSSVPICVPTAPKLKSISLENQTKSLQQNNNYNKNNKNHRRSKLKLRAAALLESLQQRMESEAPEDEEHYFGQIVASTMRRLPLQQRAIIRMDILRLLYNAEYNRE